MCALCSVFGQFGDKIKGLNEHFAAKFVERIFRKVSPSFMGPYLKFSTISLEFKGHQIDYHKGSRERASKGAVNYKFWQSSS